MEHDYTVYILASKYGGTLYTGVTNDLVYRTWQHRNKILPGFTKKYEVHRLVYYETYAYIDQAISREKRLKKWKRKWKVSLIEEHNPNWDDLYPALVGPYITFGW